VKSQTDNTNEVLLPTRIASEEAWMNQKSPVHMGLKPCPEVQEKIDDGYICLVVIDPEKSEIDQTDFVKNEDMGKVHRTGEIVYMRAHVAEEMLGVDTNKHKMTYIDTELRNRLQPMAEVI
jgi:hypothetical protein